MKFTLKKSNYEKYYKDLIPYFKREKSQKYITLILSISAAIFFFIFAINPTLSTIARLNKQISDSEIVEQKLSQKINNLSSLSQEYEKIKPDLPIIMDTIPASASAPILLAQIQSLAKQSSVIITDEDISEVHIVPRDSEGSLSFNFEVTGKSSYENLQKFLSEVLKMQRAVSLNSIQFAKQGISEELQITIKGRGYFKKL